PIVNTIVQTGNNIAQTTSNINSILGKLGGLTICITLIVAIIKFHGCVSIPLLPQLKVAPTIIKNPDTTKAIVTSPTIVSYTPKATKANPNPTPVLIEKPIEGRVSVTNGVINIQNSGFCIIPKVSYCYALGDGFQIAGGARFFFAGDFGAEILTSDHRAFLGIDVRDPIFNLLTSSLGISPSWTNFVIAPYIAESITLTL
ncbi:MAG: hypothetical protein ACREBJ_07500, partial [Nitrosotalea sp.]